MIDTTLGSAPYPATIRRRDRLARRLVFERLRAIRRDAIEISEGRNVLRFGAGDDAAAARIDVLDPTFYSEVAFGGSVGAAEAYIGGSWACDDLVGLVRILLRNRELLDGMDTGLARIKAPLRRLLHWLNRNSRSGSRRNIAAHYDLGNEFYQLWLDPTMMYSCAWFESDETSLEAAAVAKLDRICRKLDLQPGDRVLEIGTGWGGFAVHAAEHYGCHVTTTTISAEQRNYAEERVARRGLGDRIEVLDTDYRDLTGRFDKLVSIEMIEAVGHEYLETFFQRCDALLEPHGEMLLQAITIADQRYDAARKSVDFIKRYVFPGGFLPSVTALHQAMTRASRLRSVHVEDIGLHYAVTLRHWRERFRDALEAVERLGFGEDFLRLWDYYLCYCEGAFRERAIGDIQLHAIMPGARPPLHRAS